MNGLGRRPDGENRDEPEGTATGRSAGASEEQRVEGGGCGELGGGELPAGEAVVEEISGGRGQRAEAWQCGTRERASQAGEISPTGDEAGAGEGERFGPTLAAEHLGSEDGMRIDAETLRRWMLAEGLWSRRRKRKPYRQRRERRRHFGELVQMDGSFHDWLEERGPGGCMMNMTDDATSEVELRLGEEETIWAAANTLRAWIEKNGVPQGLYVDWKNLYKRAPTKREQLRGEEPVTQFGRMCGKLGIEIIAAGSPQAKGRVERNHGTHQDRLIKKMRRKKIGTHEQANVYLQQEYLPEHNGRFRWAAAEAEDYHRRAPNAAQLREVFRLESERIISNDWVVRYDNRLFQVQAQSRKYAPAQGKVVVCEWQDGRVEIEYRGRKLPWKEIFSTAPRVLAELKPSPLFRVAACATP